MKKVLFQPFHYIAGWPALAAGVAIIVLTGVVGWLGNLHLDGVLDVHIGTGSLSVFVAEGLVNWLSLGLMLLIAGKFTSASSFRIVDVMGTTALARWPFLLVVVAGLVVPYEEVEQYLEYVLLHRGSEVVVSNFDLALFGLHVLFSLLMIIWAMFLSYNGYSVSCNVSKTLGVVSFLIALTLAEVVSKLVIIFLINPYLSL